MEEKTITTETAEQVLDSVQTVSRPKSRKIAFDADGNLRTNNMSAYWIPEVEVRRVIHGTTYIVTGSYEGKEPFTRKLERIMARDFIAEEGEKNAETLMKRRDNS